MAKAFLVFKVILIAITVFDNVSNGDCFKIHKGDLSTTSATTSTSTSTTTETSNSFQIVWNNTKNADSETYQNVRIKLK